MKKRTVLAVLCAVSIICSSILALAGCSDSEEISQPSVLKIGETAKTDIVEFTLEDYQFADLICLSDEGVGWMMPSNGNSGTVPGEGKVFLWMSFSATNLYDKDLSGYNVCDIGVFLEKDGRKDGYIHDGLGYLENGAVGHVFEGEAGTSYRNYYDCAFTDGRDGFSTSPSLSGVGLEGIKPSETKEYYGYICCSDDIRDYKETSAKVVVTLPSSDGNVKFEYDITAAILEEREEKIEVLSEELEGALHEKTGGGLAGDVFLQ